MNAAEFKKLTPRLSRHAFASFIELLFRDDPHEQTDGFHALQDAGDDVFYQPYRDSYGGSIHNVYLLHYPPIELFHPSIPLNMQDPTLIDRMKVVRSLYHGRTGAWGMVDPFLRKSDALAGIGFVTNLSGLEESVYQSTIIPAYQRLKRFCGLKKPQIYVGSCDSFVDRVGPRALKIFESFLQTHVDGLVIAPSEDESMAAHFVNERQLPGGISKAALPYEPAFIGVAIEARAVLQEFDNLLSRPAKEAEIEEFLVAHYKVLFGFAYDRVETQLWLKCPELDSGRRSRRIDVFLRNSVLNDWDLVEVKRTVPLTRTLRDVPVISRQVVEAVHQVKNYRRLLMQDKVKRHFAKQGIEYFEPRLSVVIGRNPTIPQEQWRWLKSTNEGAVTLITFDEIRKDLTARLEDRYAVLEKIALN